MNQVKFYLREEIINWNGIEKIEKKWLVNIEDRWEIIAWNKIEKYIFIWNEDDFANKFEKWFIYQIWLSQIIIENKYNRGNLDNKIANVKVIYMFNK